ncbi:MAG: cytochrome P450 [Pseudomonadota bacterium]
MSENTDVYIPPHPRPAPPIASLIRTIKLGDGDLLSLLPAAAYQAEACELGYSRRSIKLFNAPPLVKEILSDDGTLFPKSDLMVGALEALIGDSIFVSDGAKWRRQRAMIEPAFSMMRLERAFAAMEPAVEACERRLSDASAKDEAFSLDLAMSHLTADIICRTVFSAPLTSHAAREVFEDFTTFERGVGQVKVWRLIVDPAWRKVDQDARVLDACQRIRKQIGALIDTHLAPDAGFNDIASAVIAARDADTGKGFSRDELIDQLGVFFLAGHETTASALTWAFYILAKRPDLAKRLRAEVDAVSGAGPIDFAAVKKLLLTRSFFQETMRLYPPLTFLPRVALQRGRIGKFRFRKGALIMISPWTLHRHRMYWRAPNEFNADRFMTGGDGALNKDAYIPFGAGPHTCVGAGFAMIESVYILARLIRNFDIEITDDAQIRPAARLTTRPAKEISVRARLHPETSP